MQDHPSQKDLHLPQGGSRYRVLVIKCESYKCIRRKVSKLDVILPMRYLCKLNGVRILDELLVPNRRTAGVCVDGRRWPTCSRERRGVVVVCSKYTSNRRRRVAFLTKPSDVITKHSHHTAPGSTHGPSGRARNSHQKKQLASIDNAQQSTPPREGSQR